MKCPKCHYLSFDPEARCKNCGHELSFAEPDLPIRSATPAGDRLDDLSLRQPEPASVFRSVATLTPPPPSQPEAAAPAAVSVFAGPASRKPDPVRHVPVTTELPLFVRGMGAPERDGASMLESDEPLVKVPAEPRAPLAVRRKAPDTGSQRARSSAPPRAPGPLDRDLLDDLQRIERPESGATAARAAGRADAGSDSLADQRAGAGTRLAAAVVDGLFLGALAVAIVWVTLRWIDVPLEQFAGQGTWLPLAPIAALILLLAVIYLLLFTAASGQTVGKMALGLRVISDDPEAQPGQPVTLKQAVWRAVLTVPSVLALGAGFIPALVGDGRAVHDRLAHTRVVRE
jgi:uncharacterized RDD family membrane protein YckC